MSDATLPPAEGPLWLVGGGNMGGAMLRGWLAAGVDPRQVTVIDPARPDFGAGVTVLAAPLDFPPMQYYQLWHERCHYSDEVRWLRRLVAEATKTLIDKP